MLYYSHCPFLILFFFLIWLLLAKLLAKFLGRVALIEIWGQSNKKEICGFFEAKNEFIKLFEMFSKCFFAKNMLKNLGERKQK